MDQNQDICVVMVPFIAQGHLNQLIHLSRLISAYNLPVHFVCAPSHTRQAKLRVHGWDPLSISNIHFHEFPIPAFPNHPPTPNATLRFPNHFMPTFNAIMHLREPFLKLLSDLSTKMKRVVIVHDYLMSSIVQDFVSNWAIGPFNPVTICDHKNSSPESIKLFTWLDKQEPNSVIYVSFGTTVSLTDEEVKEIAFGLEESGQKFIWVVREADKADIFDGVDRRVELLEGYEERGVESSEVGVVVRGWAPQLEILKHSSTGGFMSHCGWNSCMEGITMGVPIAAWPMHSDQPRNATLITEVLGTGIYAREWVRRDEKVTVAMVSDAVRRLMVSEEGCEVRKKAAELGVVVRQSVEEGGVMRKELDEFLGHITRQ
ncbi:putative trans-zeatin O-beta-D-glucosyltransferase [Helianthus annuus]|nr:putative trans-zeatin O-beta-D-glucosyltransferase [Helianthus annuus]